MQESHCCTRRSLLCGAGLSATAITAGCLSGEDDTTSASTVEWRYDPQPATDDLAVAVWETGPIALARTALDSFVSSQDEIKGTLRIPTASSRDGYDRYLGDRLANFDPPNTFLTSAGGALERYWRGVHLHDVADFLTLGAIDRWIDPAVEAITMDGTPYAIPCGAWWTDMWCYRPDVLDEVGIDMDAAREDEIVGIITRIASETSLSGAAVLDTPTERLALFALGVHVAYGDDGRSGIATGDLPLAAIKAGVTYLIELLDQTVTVTGPQEAMNAVHRGDAALTRATPSRLVTVEDTDEWALHASRPTSDSGLLDVLAVPYPKRNPGPVLTEQFLEALTASAPAKGPSTPGIMPCDREHWGDLDRLTSSMVERYHTLGRYHLAPSTGCGMDASTRWMAMERLDRIGAETSIDDATALLRPVFR